MAKAANRVVVSKGSSVVDFDMKTTKPDDMVDRMVGPTGNLRAPTIRKGKTLLVGFNEEIYTEVLGG